MPLTTAQIRHLRSLAHPLDARVRIGDKRLSEALIKEVGVQLKAHELIKVKLLSGEKHEVVEAAETLSKQLGATHVQTVGHVVTLFKRNRQAPKVEALPGEKLPKREPPEQAWRKAEHTRRAPSARNARKGGKRRR